MKFIKTLLLFFILSSCFKDVVKEVEIEVYRFDKELSSVDSMNIDTKIAEWDTILNGFHHFYFRTFLNMKYESDKQLKENILYFNREAEVIEINSEIDKNFESLSEIENDLEFVFGKFKFYFPNLEAPKALISVNSFHAYGMVTYGDTLVVGLNYYLGENHPLYSGYYDYLKLRFQEKYMIIDALENWCNLQFVVSNNPITFLDYLIVKGKTTYLMHEFLSEENQNDVFHFSETDLEWCKNNEQNIWNEIIKLNILYSKDSYSFQTFFYDSPFTKGMPNESPGRLGYWVGYKIIQNYIQNTDVSLQELMQNTNSQEILLQSKYKP